MNQPPTDLSQAIFFVSLIVLTLTLSLIFTILYHKRKAVIFPKSHLNKSNPPEKIYKILSVELSGSNNFSPLISKLKTQHQLLQCKKYSEAKTSIRKHPVDFILVTFCKQFKNNTDEFSRFNRQFPAIPIIIQQTALL